MTAQQTAPVTRHIELVESSLEITESGTGTPLIVLHGFLESRRWGTFHDLLARSYRVIAPTHPGFGTSTRPKWLQSVGDLAYFYLDLIKQLDLRDIVLVGTSLGGWIAAEIAIRSCGAIAKLVLIDAVGLRTLPTPRGPAGGSIADWLVLQPDKVRPLAVYDGLSRDDLRLPGEPGLSQEELEAIFRDREAASVYGWSPFFFNPQLPHWLHRIDVPTLVVWGERDGIVPRAVGEAYAAGIPGAQLQILPKAAHLPLLEQPAELAALIKPFLSEA